ncbi:MAG TPA: hypothetical protein VH008_18930 [Pseudonocardia sp.]|nr:hypothetical protein [Pseudonocardia sp.]
MPTPVPVSYTIDLVAVPSAPPIPTPPAPPPVPAIPSAAGTDPAGTADPTDTDPDPGGTDSAAEDSSSTDSVVTAAPRGRTARQLRIFLTGYSFHDNTPPLSAIVSHPILHRAAGGTGTYRDPITVAVPGSGSRMRWRPGTRFYLPSVRRYVIVEDSGASPPPRGVDTHLDMWIGGQGGTRSATDDCMDKLTGTVTAVLNPRPGLPVMAGPVFANHTCRIPLLGRAGGALGRAGRLLGGR